MERLTTDDKLLRGVVGGNGVFSLFVGTGLVTYSDFFRIVFDVERQWVFPVVGACLIIFAGVVLLLVSRDTIDRKSVQGIILFDTLWVAGSALLIIFFASFLTMEGVWFTAIAAVIVADFAALEYMGLRRVFGRGKK